MGLDFPPMAKGRVPKAGVLLHSVSPYDEALGTPDIIFMGLAVCITATVSLCFLLRPHPYDLTYPLLPPLAPSPNLVTLGVRASVYEFCCGTQVSQ